MKIRIHNLRLPPNVGDLRQRAADRLRIPVSDLRSVTMVKSSVDARRHREVKVCTLDAEVSDPTAVLQNLRGDRFVAAAPDETIPLYSGPMRRIGKQPLVVGWGPAGIFLTLKLLEKGYRPIVIERGKPVKPRWKDVNNYWRRGELDPESNVVFGDGGAGTFSDGKLTTRRNDPRNASILRVFADLGDAPDILTDGKPHMGTNRLSRVLIRLKDRLRAEGVEVRFGTRLENLAIEDGRIRGARLNGETLETDTVFLATGHSARDVYHMLHQNHVALEARPFAVGARAEHPQRMINESQLGTAVPDLEPADYQLAFNDRRRERSAYTFCMCPGGEVVGAATEADGLTVNGMSYSNRCDRFGNAAVVVTVRPEDYGGEGPLAGLAFQRRLETAAFAAGGGGHVAPAERIMDFLAGRPSSGTLETSYRTGVRAGDLTPLFPEAVVKVMRRGLRHFGRRVRGYDGPEGILIGVESRTSSAVRILRDPETYQSVSTAGLYPVGEGAGYAGGIVSSALDACRAMERIEISG